MAKTRITINESFEARGTHSSVTVRAEPVEHVFDEDELGRGPSHAIAKAIREGIRAITQQASASTIARRQAAVKALARGASWAVERYRGQPPTGSTRLFNDSGRLADLVVALVSGEWRIAAPAARLDPTQVDGGSMTVEHMLERLRELVPVLRDPLGDRSVREAIAATARDIIRVRR